MNIIGKFRVKVHDDQTDLIGIRTLILSQVWQAEAGRTTPDDLDEQAPPVPAAPRRMEFIGKQRRPWGGGLREFWTYTGLGDESLVKRLGKSNDYHFEPAFAQLPLLQHRNIADLLGSFGGAVVDTQIVWPPLLGGGGSASGGAVRQEPNPFSKGSVSPSSTSGRLGLSGGGSGGGGGEPNPMAGRQDYFGFGGTYHYRYVADNLDGLMKKGVRIVSADRLPGKAPSFGDRNYLVGPEGYEKHAGFFAITIQGWLSDEGGWNPYIYR